MPSSPALTSRCRQGTAASVCPFFTRGPGQKVVPAWCRGGNGRRLGCGGFWWPARVYLQPGYPGVLCPWAAAPSLPP